MATTQAIAIAFFIFVFIIAFLLMNIKYCLYAYKKLNKFSIKHIYCNTLIFNLSKKKDYFELSSLFNSLNLIKI